MEDREDYHRSSICNFRRRPRHIKSVCHNFAPGCFRCAPVFSDDAPVHTIITNSEKLVKNIYTEEKVCADVLLLALVFLFVLPVWIFPQTPWGSHPCVTCASYAEKYVFGSAIINYDRIHKR